MADNPYVRSAEFLKSGTRPEHYPPPELPEIAVAGRSNVGKSSLINRLVNRKHLAKVSNTPGRTQLLNFFAINGAFVLCDLPGYGYAKVPRSVQVGWGAMIEGYLRRRTSLRALLLLVDCRREPGDWERELAAFARARGLAVVPVATKIDKLPVSQRKPTLGRLAETLGLPRGALVGWSATNGEGLDALWRAIERHVSAPLTAAEAAQAPEEGTPPAEAVIPAAPAAPAPEPAPPARTEPPMGSITRTRRFEIRRDPAGLARAVARPAEAEGAAVPGTEAPGEPRSGEPGEG